MKVSVIIPCYNVEKYVENCLRSVQEQSHSDMEVICVNDGSTDRTAEIVKDFASNSDLDLILIEQNNEGACSARNNGLNRASGEYIQFLDADDLLMKNKISHQLELVSNNDHPDVIVGSYRRQDESGKVLFEKVYRRENEKDIWLGLLRSDLGITSSNLFRADLFKNGVEWNTQLQSSQEYDLLFQILQQRQKMTFDDEINTIIQERSSGAISRSNLGAKWARYIDLRIRILSYLKEYNIEFNRQEAYQLLFDAIRFLYPHDPAKAVELHKESIPKDFTPQVSEATGRSYLTLYKVFGFQLSERLRGLISSSKAN